MDDSLSFAFYVDISYLTFKLIRLVKITSWHESVNINKNVQDKINNKTDQVHRGFDDNILIFRKLFKSKKKYPQTPQSHLLVDLIQSQNLWLFSLIILKLYFFQSHSWSANLQPIADHFLASYKDFLPKLIYPVRVGEHANSAFGLIFPYEYAKGGWFHQAFKLTVFYVHFPDCEEFFNRQGMSIWLPTGLVRPFCFFCVASIGIY